MTRRTKFSNGLAQKRNLNPYFWAGRHVDLLTLFQAIAGGPPRRIMEAGAGDDPVRLHSSRAIRLGVPAILVDPRDVEGVFRQAFPAGKFEFVQAAIARTAGPVGIREVEPGVFMTVPEDGNRGTVPGVPMSSIDPGDLDVLILDLEGDEMIALEDLRSVPTVIQVETHFPATRSTSPVLDQILEFMAETGRQEIARTYGGDSVFVKI